MLIRATGCVLLVLCGWACGLALYRKAAQHTRALEQTVRLLCFLQEGIRYRRENLKALLAAAQLTALCPELALDACGTLQSLMPPPCFSADEKTAFTACFSGLGHTFGVQECERLKDFCIQFESFLRDAREKEQRAAAVDVRLGLAIGAMAGIALL